MASDAAPATSVYRPRHPERTAFYRIFESHFGFQTKILDFGLAKSMGEDANLSVSGMIVGSPAYMSPEQVRQQPLDPQSDLFSLASVTYELLCGTAAFGAESLSDVMTKVLLSDPPPLSSRLAGVGAEIDAAFAEAFQKEREKRPPTVSAWGRPVAALLLSLPPGHGGWLLDRLLGVKPSPPEQLQPTVRM